MKGISWKEFLRKLDDVKFDKFDLIVAIGNGGIIPAAFVQNILKIPMKIIWIQYRDEENNPLYEDARLIEAELTLNNKRILFVDDVCRTGKTLNKAKQYLIGNKIKTFVVNGKADYSLYNTKECLKMPWKKAR